MIPSKQPPLPAVAVIGGGPAGLMAAEVLAGGGVRVDVYDAMPSMGRKFLMAGKGGMNITHSEPFDVLVTRYGNRMGIIFQERGSIDCCGLKQMMLGHPGIRK